MDARLQLRVQRYGWDAAAPYYHDGWLAQLRLGHETLMAMADLQPGHRVLETACGSGIVTAMAAEAVGPDGAVLATDISERMVDETSRRLAAAGHRQVTTARMGAEALEVDDDAFDRAICALGLMFVPEPARALEEMRRIVRPGGRVSVLVWGERRKCGWADIFPIIDARVKSEVCPLFFALGAPGALASALAATGLRDVVERRITTDLRFSDEREVLNAVIDAGAVALAAKRFTPGTRRDVERDYLASIAQHRSGAGYKIPGEFVIASGIV